MRLDCVDCFGTDAVRRNKRDVFGVGIILSLKRKLITFSWWMKNCMWVKYSQGKVLGLVQIISLEGFPSERKGNEFWF